MRLVSVWNDVFRLDDLHPRLTVVVADATVRRSLRRGVAGIVDVDGIRLDLDGYGRDLLGLPPEGGLVVGVDLLPPDPRVGARTELVRAEAAHRAARAAEQDARRRVDAADEALVQARRTLDAAEQASADRDERRRELTRTRAELLADLDRAEAEAGAAEAALVSGRDRRELALAARHRADAAVTAARAELQALRATLASLLVMADALAALPGTAPADVENDDDALERALADAELYHARAVQADEAARAEVERCERELLDRVSDLAARRATIRRDLDVLDRLDPEPLRVALAAYEDAMRDGDGAHPEAAQLADAWEQLEAQTAARLAFDGRADVAEARRAVREASERLLALEQEVRGSGPDRQARADIERLHDELLAVQDRRGRNDRRRTEQLEQELSELLARHGLRSYTELVMGGASSSLDPERAERVDRARAALREAEARLAALQPVDLADEPSLARRRARLRQETDLLFGGEVRVPDAGAEVVAALRALPYVPAGVQRDLVTALRRAGAAVQGSLVDAARRVLDQSSRSQGRREELAEDLAEIDVELTADDAVADSRMAAARRAADAAAAARSATAARLQEATTARQAAVGRTGTSDARARVAPRLDDVRADIARHEARALECADGLTALEEAARLAELSVAATTQEMTAAEQASSAAATRRRDLGIGLTAIERELAGLGDLPDLAEHAALLDAAKVERAAAGAGLGACEQQLAEALHVLGMAVAADEAAEAFDADAYAHQLELALLGELSDRRTASYAGGVPLVVPDVFDLITTQHKLEVLDRLERFGDAVQVVFFTEDPAALAWAEELTRDRGALYTLQEVSP